MNGAADRPGGISFDDFPKVEVVTGTIIDVRVNAKAQVSAFVVDVDSGSYGHKTSSASSRSTIPPRR